MSNLAEILGLYMRVNSVDYRSMAARIGIPTSNLNRFVNGHGDLSAENFMKVLNWLVKTPRHTKPKQDKE